MNKFEYMRCVAFDGSRVSDFLIWSLVDSNLEKVFEPVYTSFNFLVTILETLNWGQRNKLENEREVGIILSKFVTSKRNVKGEIKTFLFVNNSLLISSEII